MAWRQLDANGTFLARRKAPPNGVPSHRIKDMPSASARGERRVFQDSQSVRVLRASAVKLSCVSVAMLHCKFLGFATHYHQGSDGDLLSSITRMDKLVSLGTGTPEDRVLFVHLVRCGRANALPVRPCRPKLLGEARDSLSNQKHCYAKISTLLAAGAFACANAKPRLFAIALNRA